MDPTALRLAFAVVLAGPLGSSRCTARELSARGVVVESDAPYDVGAHVTVTFSLPDGSYDDTLECIVERVQHTGRIASLALAFVG